MAAKKTAKTAPAKKTPAKKGPTKKAARPTKMGGAAKQSTVARSAKRKDAEFDLALETAKIASMGTDELHDLYEDTFGKPTRSNNLPHLRSTLVKAMADKARGEMPMAEGDEKMPLAKRIAAVKLEEPRDPRLPAVGSVLERRYKDQVIKVKVLAEGFQHAGQHHKSLSALAKTFTGCATNGFLWFGLGKAQETAPSKGAEQ